MKTVKIFFSDLIPEKQKELLDACKVKDPKEMNWDMDILPIAFFDCEDDDE